jgi:hypothetical protein
MALSHQLFTSDCGCEIEQLHDPDEGIQPIPIVLHKVCGKHEAVVKNKRRLSMATFGKKRDEILERYQTILYKNRERHLKEFDNHPSRVEKRKAIAEMKVLKDWEKHALIAEEKMGIERDQTIRFLDEHEQSNMFRLMTGLNSQYSMFAKEVHDAIMSEQNG